MPTACPAPAIVYVCMPSPLPASVVRGAYLCGVRADEQASVVLEPSRHPVRIRHKYLQMLRCDHVRAVDGSVHIRTQDGIALRVINHGHMLSHLLVPRPSCTPAPYPLAPLCVHTLAVDTRAVSAVGSTASWASNSAFT